MFEEGAATHWGDDALYYYKRGNVGEIFAEVADGDFLPQKDYGTAAHFVSYLELEYGSESVIGLLDTMKRGDLHAAVDREFQDILGVSFDHAIETYEQDYDWCHPFIARSSEISCELAEPITCQTVHFGGDPGSNILLPYVEAEVSCGAAGTLGPRYDEIWRSFTFDIPVAGMYALSATPLPQSLEVDSYDPWGYVMVEQCGSGCGRFSIEMPSETGNWAAQQLEPGRYRVRMAVRLDAPDDSLAGFAFSVQGMSNETRAALCAG